MAPAFADALDNQSSLQEKSTLDSRGIASNLMGASLMHG
jgi:hypothetical protein